MGDREGVCGRLKPAVESICWLGVIDFVLSGDILALSLCKSLSALRILDTVTALVAVVAPLRAFLTTSCNECSAIPRDKASSEQCASCFSSILIVCASVEAALALETASWAIMR